MLNLKVLFWLCAVIARQETSGSGTVCAVLSSVAVAGYGEELNSLKGCNTLAVLQAK